MKPTVLPRSEDGRAAGCPAAPFISLVGSSTRIAMPKSPVRILELYSALRRLAIDAGADRCRYRPGLAAHPRGNHRAEAAGRTSRGHDQQIIRRFERGMNTVASIAHNGALSDIGPFRPADSCAL